jgi:hypothetical protein
MPGMSDPKPIQIFRPGRHVAMSGDVLDFTEADLAASAAAYDPAKHEAPIVVGHPKLDAPAYGWVKSVAYSSAPGGLEAAPHQVEPAFAEMVAAGRFKKVSASFFSPTSPQNPVPGVWYLRHVGFLGATPPAVKGLRAPDFAEGGEGVVEFADWAAQQNAGLWRRMRDFLIAQFGLEKADTVIPDYSIGTLEDAARTEAVPMSAFSEPPPKEAVVTPEQKAALEAENAQLKQQIADSAARDKASAAAARHAEHASFAEAQVTAGRLTPAQRDVAVAALDALSEAPVEFGEGDAKKPLTEAFKEFLAALPKQVEFGEVAGKGSAGAGAATAEFAAPAGFSIDGDAAALHRKALAHQAQHKTDYLTAVKAVSTHS